MANEVIDALMRITLTGSAAILLVLVLRWPMRRLAGARVGYGLWLLVPVAAAAAFLPTRMAPEPLAQIDAVLGPVTLYAPRPEPAVRAEVLVGLWLAGVLAGLTQVAVQHRRFLTAVGPTRRRADGALQAEQSRLGPAVVGVLAPRIVLPADFESRFTPMEQDVIMAHETEHLRAGHARLNAVVALVQCIVWFNPFAHLAGRLWRVDQELACDAAVIGRHPDRRRTYAEALVKAGGGETALPLGCYWPGRRRHALVHRVAMLNVRQPGRATQGAAVTAVAVLSLLAGYTAWAAQPPRPVALTRVPSRPLPAQGPAAAPAPLPADTGRPAKVRHKPRAAPVRSAKDAALEAGDWRQAAELGASAEEVVRALQARGRHTDVIAKESVITIGPDNAVDVVAVKPLPPLPGDATDPVAHVANLSGSGFAFGARRGSTILYPAYAQSFAPEAADPPRGDAGRTSVPHRVP